MNEANEIILLLQALIAAGAIPRMMQCYFKWKTDPEQGSTYKRRGINALAFVVVAEIITSFLYLVKSYIT